jgi:hypothetical protein
MGKAARAWVLDHYVNGRVLSLAVCYYQNLLDRNLPSDLKKRLVSPDSALNPTY